MAAEQYNGWWLSATGSGQVGPSSGTPTTEQINNATLIHDFFAALGWSESAIAGMLGNIMYESRFNPADIYPRSNYPQSINSLSDLDNNIAVNVPQNIAMGLVQWYGYGQTAPITNKIVSYAIRNGYQWYDGDVQLMRIKAEYDQNLQWHSLTINGTLWTWNNYVTNTQTPEMSAEIWVRCYEVTSSVMSIRKANARYWYDYFGGQPPVPTDWISGEDFATIALSYDGQYIPYDQCDCLDFINLVWHNIPAVASNIDLGRINGRYGTNTLWRSTRTFSTTDPYGQNPTNELWVKDDLGTIEALFGGSLPAGCLLFHQISEAGPPPIPSYYAGDGIGNFAHVGIYCGNNEVMQSGGQDAGSIPGGGVHKSAFDITAWNYAAFCVYVDPTQQPPTPPEPPEMSVIQLLMMFKTIKREGKKNAIRQPV